MYKKAEEKVKKNIVEIVEISRKEVDSDHVAVTYSDGSIITRVI